MKRYVLIVVVVLLACAARVEATKPSPPVEATLVLANSGAGSVAVQWSGDRRAAFDGGVVRFFVRPEGSEETVAEPEEFAVFEGGESHEELSYSFEPASPGLYRVFGTFTTLTATGQRSATKSLLVDVPASGEARVTKGRLGSARDFAGPEGPVLKIDDTLKASVTEKGASFIVKATIKYTDRTYTSGAFTGTALLPVRKARIEIRDSEFIGSELVQTALTDNSGSFAVTVPNNNDGDGTGRDIFLRVVLDNSRGRVQDHFGFVFSTDSTTQNNWPGGTLDFGIRTISLVSSGPYNIYEAINRGYDYAVARGDTIPPKITAVWSVGNQDLVSNTTYFSNPEKRMYVLGDPADPDEFDDDVLLHEYGHAAMYHYSFTSAVFGAHDWDTVTNNKLAWAEGWASYYSCAARNSKFFVDHDASSFTAHNIETLNTVLSAAERKENVEGAVAGALFDIFDTPADGVDNLANGSGTIWAIFTNYIKSPLETRFRDFYNGWRAYQYPALDKVDAIMIDFGMAFAGGRVTFPNADGTILHRTKTYQIKWSGLNGTNVEIKLHNGAALQSTISASTANDGVFNWTVSAASVPLGDNYRIQIAALPSKNQYDYSDYAFTVMNAPPTLTVNGSSVAGSISGIEDTDWFVFTAASSGTYTLNSTAGTLTDGYMELYGPNSQSTFIEADDDDGTGTMPRIVRNLSPGTYYVSMQGFGELDIGTYSVRVTK